MGPRDISIPMGGLAIGREHNILRTFVGSCVALCIYDETKKIGGMAHIMLPKNVSGKSVMGILKEGKFADEAIDIMIEKLNEISPNLKLKAKMAGGATIFTHKNDFRTANVGNKNIIGIRLLLQEKKIPLVAQLVGAKNGRWITFYCDVQKIVVKDNEDEKTI